jgi:hypothetical protein
MSDNRGGMRDSGRGYPDGGGGGSGSASGGRSLDRDRGDRDRGDRDRGDRDRGDRDRGDRDRGRDHRDYYGGGDRDRGDRDRYGRGRSRSRSRSPPSRRDGGGGSGPYGSASHLGGQVSLVSCLVGLPYCSLGGATFSKAFLSDNIMFFCIVSSPPLGGPDDPGHDPWCAARYDGQRGFEFEPDGPG